MDLSCTGGWRGFLLFSFDFQDGLDGMCPMEGVGMGQVR